MNFAKVFIRRPVLAMVISIVIVLAGGVCIFSLPAEQYPNITPPTAQVTTNYVGASADVMEQSVAIPIEQAVNGAENMLYIVPEYEQRQLHAHMHLRRWHGCECRGHGCSEPGSASAG
jgi:multidrug efflux pump subunit AcrB